MITNALLVNEGAAREGDLLVVDERIAAIGGDLGSRQADRVIDAGGRWLLPGLIDDQVHFRDPGYPNKGTIRAESRAAVAGGVTSVMEMPNTDPATTTAERLEDKIAIARRDCAANYAFYLGATNDNLEDIRSIDPTAVAGIKIFMGASTGNMLVDDPAILEAIFREAPTLIATHCEDTPMIERNLTKARETWGDDVPVSEHPIIRSEEACWKSSKLAVDLARKHGARLHVLHLTTARELAHFELGPPGDAKLITGEACIHHLTFDDRDYATLGNRLKCNPAVKTPADRQAIREAVMTGLLDVVATDHAPHTREEKDGPYLQAPAGLPLVQHLLPALLELVHDGLVTRERAVELACHAPAEVFGVIDRGYLREGAYADLTLVSPDAPWTVDDRGLESRCGWSPFEGRTFRSRVDLTVVNGQVACEDGQVSDRLAGQRIAFRR